jgi:hypothetical protein
MDRDWEYAVQETVGSDRYVPLPDPVRESVERDHPLDGPSVVWNYERNSNYVVLSSAPLSEPSYVDVGRYKVYGADDASQARVRPPDRLTEVLPATFARGDRVMYLAYEAMVDDENPTAYLLSTGQLLDLLPDGTAAGAVGDGGDDVRRAILRSPGFLPTP